MAELSKKQQRRARDERIARGLGISVQTLLEARKTLVSADEGLMHLSKPGRAAAAARRLGITVTELKILRRGLGEPNSPDSDRVRSLLRAGLSPIAKERDHSSGPARHYEKLGGRVAPRGVISRRGQPDAYTILFVTSWRNVVHLYYDCKGTRGFLHIGEPDNAVYKVEARDPCCRGRRVCRVCEPEQGTGWVALLTRVLVSLHGRMLEDDEWEQHSWNRPLPQGPPYRGIARRSHNSSGRSNSVPVGPRRPSRSTARSVSTPRRDGEATPILPTGFGSTRDRQYQIGDKVTWHGYEGVITELSPDRMLLAIDGRTRIAVPRRELDR